MILLSEILSKVSEKDIMEHYYHCSITDRKAIYKNIIRNDKEGTCYFNWFRGHYYLVDRGRGIDFNFNCLETDEEYEHRLEREAYLKQRKIEKDKRYSRQEEIRKQYVEKIAELEALELELKRGY